MTCTNSARERPGTSLTQGHWAWARGKRLIDNIEESTVTLPEFLSPTTSLG